MECSEIKRLLPLFVDDALEPEQRTDIQVHLSSCPECQKEFQAYRRSWEILDEAPELEPDPAYMSRFWTNLGLRTPWYHTAGEFLRNKVMAPRIAPVWMTACLLLVLSVFIARQYWQIQETEMLLTSLPLEEVELIDNIEIAENYEIIEDLEVLENLEVLEVWETS